MRVVYKIARAELRSLFYSPVAWFIALVFYVLLAAIFFQLQNRYAGFQDMFLDNMPDWIGFAGGLTQPLLDPVKGALGRYLYLFTPLLTMGVISREVASGSIRLLYSSPINTASIVVGKYIGMMVFSLVMLSGFTFVLASATFTITSANTALFLSVLLGYFLLINAYIAIGIFISCLTNYPVVAAIFTFLVFFLLSSLSGLWQQYDLIRDLTYAMSLSGKAENFIRGLITSRELVYFLLIIGMFVAFSIIRLQGIQESKGWTQTISKYLTVFALVLTLGYISSRSGMIGYLDVTENKTNTLHPSAQQVLQKFDGSPLTVTLYANLFTPMIAKALPQARNEYVWGLWEKVFRFYPNIHFRYEYYYNIKKGDSSLYKKYPGKNIDEIAGLEAEKLGIAPSLFKKASAIDIIDQLNEEDLELVMELAYKDRKSLLRTYREPNPWPDQGHIAASMMRLQRDKEPKVVFLTGHLERSPYRFTGRDYGSHISRLASRKSLINHGVDTDTFSVERHPIPDDVDLLIVADPKVPYSDTALARVDQYIQRGGNAIFFVEPGKYSLLNPVLRKMRVQIDPGIIVHPNKDEMPHIALNELTDRGNYLAKEPDMEMYQRHRQKGGAVMNEGAANIRLLPGGEFYASVVLAQPGGNDTWVENGTLVVDSAAPVFSPAEKDWKANVYALAVSLIRNVRQKEQRIIVASDADFMSKTRERYNTINLAFYSWGLYNVYPVYTNYDMEKDRYFKIDGETAQLLVDVCVYLLPVLFLLCGIIFLVRRRRK